MCSVCHDEWCEFPGDLCYPDDYPEFYDDQPSADVMEVINQQTIESESSMSKKAVEVEVEKDTDKNGIITKQSEVYVWNDTVFASYKSALAASKKDSIFSVLIKNYCTRHYPTYTKTQVDNLIKTWSKNPTSYSIPLDICFDSFAEMLAE